MGDVVSIGRLIIYPDDMLEGSLESTGAQAGIATWGSGYEALDDSSGPEVLALLAGGRRTELIECDKFASNVVAALLVSYLHWGVEDKGLVGAPPSEGGIYGASVAWDGEPRGTRAEEALCLGVQLCEGAAKAPRVLSIWK